MTTGQTVDHPDMSGLSVDTITATARRYGLHATIKPPFRLAPGCDEAGLTATCTDLCAQLEPVSLQGLQITTMGRFLALCPTGDVNPLNKLAAACVEALDPFRAPATADELERRRANRLSERQEANLRRWGYPFVMDQFRFHITLTGRLPKEDSPAVQAVLAGYVGPHLPAPFVVSELALVGEAEDGRFHVIHRYPLTGSSASRNADIV